MKEFTQEHFDKLQALEDQYMRNNFTSRTSPTPCHTDDQELQAKMNGFAHLKDRNPDFSMSDTNTFYEHCNEKLTTLANSRYKGDFAKDLAMNFDERLKTIGIELTDKHEKAAYLSALGAYCANNDDYIKAQENDIKTMLDDGPDVYRENIKEDAAKYNTTDKIFKTGDAIENMRKEPEAISFDTLVDEDKPKDMDPILSEEERPKTLWGKVTDFFNALHKNFAVNMVVLKTGFSWPAVSALYDEVSAMTPEERAMRRSDPNWNPAEDDYEREDRLDREKIAKGSSKTFGQKIMDIVNPDVEDVMDDEDTMDDDGPDKEDELDILPTFKRKTK